jgi:hypothetical protein
MAEIHRMRKRSMPEEPEYEPKFTHYVLGPLKVIANIPAGNEGYVDRLFATLPNGNAVLLYDQSGCNMFETICIEDTIICTNAIFEEWELDNPSWTQYGAYNVQDSVYILRDGQATELPGWEPQELG